MKRRSIYALIASSLCLLVPAPGRFVFGFTLVLELNILMLFATLFSSLIKKMQLEQMNSVLMLICMLTITMLFRQIMVIFQPEVILTLGFIIYLLPFSLFITGYLFSEEKPDLKSRLSMNMIHSSTYSIFALMFFLVRDILGFGTFTFYGANHQIYEKVILKADTVGIFSLLASIPGALIMASLILFIHITVRNKFSILRKVEVQE